MWTPKRILMLLGGLSLFLITYLVYAFFLGGIDGLPPLPLASLLPVGPPVQPPPFRVPKADEQLAIAFGPDCEELKRSIKIELRARGLVLATDQFNIVQSDKHKVQLVPFSAALFGKTQGEGDFPEINTMIGDEAILIFDRPIENIAEAGERKIVGAELYGKITLINNRHTAKKSDDIVVRISNGPLHYSEPKNRIWSDGFVNLIDTQSQPKPTDIKALGLDIQLSKEVQTNVSAKAAKTDSTAKKAPTKSVTGVEKLILRSNVDMFFHVDSRSGFLGTNTVNKEEPPPDKKLTLVPEKLLPPPAPTKPVAPSLSQVTVHTQGAFTYDVEKDLGVFESPETSSVKKKTELDPFPSDSVKVTRSREQGEGEDHDQLICDKLELQFRKKKEGEPRGPNQDQDGGREIDSARATVRLNPADYAPNQDPEERHQVIVLLSTENLHAYCEELIYHCATGERGPETILRGRPMKAIKDGHVISAPEVQLIGANKQGEGQYAFAKGPGQLHLLDNTEKIKTPQYHAMWKDSLVVTKDKEGSKVFDLLTFIGDAGFVDDAHKQELHARKLMVWLEQAERLNVEQPQSQKDKAGASPRQQPHKLEGFEKISMRSEDMNIKDSDYLIVRFKNEASTPDALPNVAEVAPASKGQVPGGANGQVVTVSSAPPEPEKKSRKPIELEAKRVSVYVTRTGSKSELEEAVTEGKVRVKQEASSDKEKGVDITGDLLHIYHYKDGDVMVVFGDPVNRAGYANLQLGDLRLIGPQVTINQRDNTAEVKGDGVMQLPSGTNFDGSKSSKPGVMLNVFWKEEMFFNGKDAAFLGNVSAEQEDSKLLCQTLHVYLDKMVSFKEGESKGGQGAKVERLVSSGKVYTEDLKKDEKKQFVRYDRLTGLLLTMDNKEDRITVSGPGRVHSLQYGSMDEDDKKPKSAQQKQLYLTRVDYQDRMYSNKDKDGNRIVKFSGNVEVYHFPSNKVDDTMTPEKLPKDGMYIRSDKLTVYSKAAPAAPAGAPAPQNKAQEMHAEGNVFFLHGDVRGKAPVMHYNQETEQVILEGTATNRALLEKSRGAGLEPERVYAISIVYNRKTGLFSTSGVPLIQGSAK